jgi:RNA polymerase sigma-70 factor (ECF subfamily)
MSDPTQRQDCQDASCETSPRDALAREATTGAATSHPSPADRALVEALRRGDEAAFERLVEEYCAPLLRLAMLYVRSRAVAEEVVQETWIGVLRGLDRFEGRSSLKTWIFRILTNTAKTRAQREGRSVPFSALSELASESRDPAVEPDRFLPPDDPQWPGHWASIPHNWDEVPEERLLSLETRERIRAAIEGLPPTQREVIILRDVDGWTSEEVCNLLSISESNQRVLLHRARTRVRRALDDYIAGE